MNEQTLATGKKLLASTGIAFLAAGVLLATVILPAEYGIDPSGVGAALGIKGMSAAEQETKESSGQAEDAAVKAPLAPLQSEGSVSEPLTEAAAVWKSDAAYRSDEQMLTLAPNEGAEVKALMKAGERFVFSWEATGLVNFDMHGEVAGAKSNEFTSHWKGRQEQGGHGAFVAPFDGTHGWYWRNRGVKPVTVTVKTSGFYAKLYRP